jgi:hypothetical protein
VIFSDLVLHQRALMNKAFERYQFGKQFLFPQERGQAQDYMRSIEQGLSRYQRLVLDSQRYIDFGSGKEEPIVGAHGRSSAIIHLLESTNRAIADFQRFLNRTTTPEAVEAKCQSLPADQCMSPCHKFGGRFTRNRCGYQG